MEDSDHEHSSSSDEQDSCPASPNQSRHHDHDHHEQVPVTPPQIYIYFSVTAHLQLISAVKVCSFYALKLRIRHEFISLGSKFKFKTVSQCVLTAEFEWPCCLLNSTPLFIYQGDFSNCN